jgi:hypothetical protein
MYMDTVYYRVYYMYLLKLLYVYSFTTIASITYVSTYSIRNQIVATMSLRSGHFVHELYKRKPNLALSLAPFC